MVLAIDGKLIAAIIVSSLRRMKVVSMASKGILLSAEAG